MAGSYKSDNETSGSVNFGEFMDKLRSR